MKELEAKIALIIEQLSTEQSIEKVIELERELRKIELEIREIQLKK